MDEIEDDGSTFGGHFQHHPKKGAVKERRFVSQAIFNETSCGTAGMFNFFSFHQNSAV
jgi:hypothetical protein